MPVYAASWVGGWVGCLCAVRAAEETGCKGDLSVAGALKSASETPHYQIPLA